VRIRPDEHEQDMIAIGSPAPDFTLPDDRGNFVELQELRGSWVVLWWFPKAATGGCTREGQAFRDRVPQFAEVDAWVLGASFDTQADNRAFSEAQSFTFPLLSDEDRSVAQLYGVVRDPTEMSPDLPRRTTFLIDPSGHVAKVYEVRDKEAHPGEVLADVRRLSGLG
jgi:peroxiredoxin Q/BCP